MPTQPNATFAINLLNDENDPVQVPWPIEAHGMSSDASDITVWRIIARVEQTLGARRGSIELGRTVIAPNTGRIIRMGRVIRLVLGPLDANGLVSRLELLLGRGVQQGAIEENGRLILEMVISDKIANLELEIVVQIYRERVNHMDERVTEFTQSQELP
ncbi:hypothetical protein D1007_55753 [Hordeum vulgare]|nr:hypothetical protein D1007_55753 [Hordeum vulgare]